MMDMLLKLEPVRMYVRYRVSLETLASAADLVFVGTVHSSPVENLEIVFPDDKAADFDKALMPRWWQKPHAYYHTACICSMHACSNSNQ